MVVWMRKLSFWHCLFANTKVQDCHEFNPMSELVWKSVWYSVQWRQEAMNSDGPKKNGQECPTRHCWEDKSIDKSQQAFQKVVNWIPGLTCTKKQQDGTQINWPGNPCIQKENLKVKRKARQQRWRKHGLMDKSLVKLYCLFDKL